MALAPEIPLNVCKAFRPNCNDPVSLSHVFIVHERNPEPLSTTMFRIPNRHDISWTHFKINWESSAPRPQLSLIYRTDFDVEIPINNDYFVGDYTMFKWIIPGIPLAENADFYIAIHFPETTARSDHLRLELVGFEGLIHDDDRSGYLFTYNDQPSFAFIYDDVTGTYVYTRNHDPNRNEYMEVIHSSYEIAHNIVP
jgi:hypothetical protein